jgi:mono/diheme cytochrome c family protein
MRTKWNAGCGALALLAALAGPAVAEDGEQLFKAKCNSCHGAKKVLDGVRKVEADKRQTHFDKFLAGHFASDPAQRQAIVDYLIAATK